MRVASFSGLYYNKSIPKKAWLLIMASSSSTHVSLIEPIQKQKSVVSCIKTGWFITQQHFHETQFDFRYKNNCVWRANTCFNDADGETTAKTRWNHLFVTFPRHQGYKGRLWNCVLYCDISPSQLQSGHLETGRPWYFLWNHGKGQDTFPSGAKPSASTDLCTWCRSPHHLSHTKTDALWWQKQTLWLFLTRQIMRWH